MKKYLFLAIASSNILLFGAGEKLSGTCEHCGNGLSNAFVNVVKKCRSSVVYIETKQKQATSEFGGIDPMDPFQNDLLERFFGGRRREFRNEAPEVQGSGTGFIVSEDGYIVTNYHVVKDASEIKVEIYGDSVEKEYKAELIGYDHQTDIAILHIDEKDLPYLEFADSDKIEPGQWIVAIGHPLRLRDSVTAGVISAKHRMNLQITELGDFVQTDASLNPGSSGSPLLDLEGKVVAVNTAIIPPTGKNMGVGFSVPSNIAQMVYDQVKTSGVVSRGFLGVNIQDLTSDLAEGFGLKKGTKGALISEVAEGSAGEKAGLQTADVVIAFNGESIKDASSFATFVGRLPSGNKSTLTIYRAGKKMDIDVVLGSKMKDVSIQGDSIHKLGVIVEELTDITKQKYQLKASDSGVLIKEVIPGSLAHRAGWKVDSVIMAVNGEKVQSIADLCKALEKSKDGKKVVALLSFKGHALYSSISVS